jgi:DNA (cytosine-5)-methyltransferase 1
MTRPKLLDLFCCEGGASVGYERAGCAVYGVDLFVDFTRGRYPGPAHTGDAILLLARLLAGESVPFTHLDGRVEWLVLSDFAFIHASPPCQHASAGTRALRKDGAEYLALIAPTRWLLQQTGLRWVIENVRGADLRNPVELCGCQFGLTALDEDGLPLRLERPRHFESNVTLTAPRPCYHDPGVWVAGSYGGARKAKRRPGETLAEVAPRDRYAAKYVRKGGYVPRSKRVQQDLLGIDWMTVRGMHQSLPPIYCQHIGVQLAHLESVAA